MMQRRSVVPTLGRTDIGHLSPGTRADIAVFDLDDAIMAPSIDPITTLVTGGSGKVTAPSSSMAVFPCSIASSRA